MPWVRLEDNFPEHSKIAGLSAHAFRLHVEALCYCARNLTDGYISEDALKRFTGARRSAGRVAELVEAGCWVEAELPDECTSGARPGRLRGAA